MFRLGRLAVASVISGFVLGGLGATGLGLPAPVVGAAVSQAPTLGGPSSGATLTNFGPSLSWQLPSGSTQYQLQVTPFHDDGPAVNIIANAATSFDIPAPPDWYGLLPDMTYSWRVRATDAATSVAESDGRWSPWSPAFTFRTPAVSAGITSPFAPESGMTVSSLTPVLTWSSTTDDIYYWEVQVSKDPAFGSQAFLYSELRHGGVTVPTNSYAIPTAFPLEPGTLYYWRVRPRVQGDGTPVPWPSASSFKTLETGKLFLQVDSPADHSTVNAATLAVTGKTKPGALVTVNDAFRLTGSDGSFSIPITLTEGVNNLDIIASDTKTRDTVTVSRVVTYIP